MESIKSIIRSVLTYPAFANMPKKLLNKLKKVESRAESIIGTKQTVPLNLRCAEPSIDQVHAGKDLQLRVLTHGHTGL